MKPFVTLLMFMLCMTITSKAQNYLDHLRQATPGLGTVTVNQSKAIDELVNGQQKKSQPDSVKKPEHHEPQATNKEKEKVVSHESPVKKTETEKEKEETETPTVDMRKKVMRSSYKVTGYRVQAFAGGNSRNDRIKAEQIGNAIKMKFPEMPVYVHFYSPRWICRVGNFRSLAEAQKMLQKVRAMGYKQACLVKGQITVQN